MLQIVIFTYLFLISYFVIKEHNYTCAAILVASIPVLILILKGVKKSKISKYKKLIEEARNKEEITPFININKAPYYILELIPGVERIYAKKIVNQRRNKVKFSTFEEFANFCSLPLIHYSLTKKIIKF